MEPNVGTDTMRATRQYFQWYLDLFEECMGDLFSPKELKKMAMEKALHQADLPTRFHTPPSTQPPSQAHSQDWECMENERQALVALDEAEARRAQVASPMTPSYQAQGENLPATLQPASGGRALPQHKAKGEPVQSTSVDERGGKFREAASLAKPEPTAQRSETFLPRYLSMKAAVN
jgi:hypothetical protein